MLIGGVLDAPVMQVVVESGLVDRVHRAKAHRHRGELPEVRHQPRVRVGRQPAAGVAVLLAEAVKLLCAESSFEECARVDARRGVALDEDLVAAAGMGLAAEEMVETDLVKRRRRRVGRNMASHTDSRALSAVHHDRGVPSDPRPVAPLDVLVAGKPRLEFGRDGVHIVGRCQRGDGHPLFAGAFQQPQHQIAGPRRPRPLQQLVERLKPLGGLFGIDIGQIRCDAFTNHPNPVGFGCGGGVLGQVLAHELGGQLPLLVRRYRCLRDRRSAYIVPLSCPTCTAGGGEWNEPAIEGPNR